MGKVLLDDNSGNAGSMEIGPGVYASEMLIKNIEDISNHPSYSRVYKTNKGFEPEIGLIVTCDTGLGFDKQVWLLGKYVKDKVTGNVKGWIIRGNAVQRFLAKMLGKDALINEDGTIPPELFPKIIGKSIIVVQFVDKWYNNKPSYSNWDKVFTEGTTLETIQQEWLENVKWIKKYKPSIIVEYNAKRDEEKLGQDTSFDTEKFNKEEVI